MCLGGCKLKKYSVISILLTFSLSVTSLSISAEGNGNYSISKESIILGMLDSVDHYSNVSGEFSTNIIDNSQEFIVNYNTDIDSQVSYEKISSTSTYIELTHQDQITTEYDNKSWTVRQIRTKNFLDKRLSKNKVISQDITKYLPLNKYEQRIILNENGTDAFIYREQLTNTPYAKMSLQPQELVFSFLSRKDLWDFDGVIEYLNRSCLVITGITETYYQEKLDVTSFKLFVDIKTGILLFYEGYSKDGDVSEFLRTLEINIDNESNIQQLNQTIKNKKDVFLNSKMYKQLSKSTENNTNSMKSSIIMPFADNSSNPPPICRDVNINIGYNEWSTSYTRYMQYYIDNDTIASGCKNKRGGFPTYLTVNSKLFNKDARREVANAKTSYYGYESKEFACGYNYYDMYMQLAVYLNDSSFTDVAAVYTIGDDIADIQAATINQKYAPAGWTLINNIVANGNVPGYGPFRVNTVMVYPSGYSAGYTGADAIALSMYTQK